MHFRPLHDRVLVRRIDAEEKTAGDAASIIRLPHTSLVGGGDQRGGETSFGARKADSSV